MLFKLEYFFFKYLIKFLKVLLMLVGVCVVLLIVSYCYGNISK